MSSTTKPVQCFLVEPTGRAVVFHRRYRSVSVCSASGSYCNAMLPGGEADASQPCRSLRAADVVDRAMWPLCCDACGQPFADGDEWQLMLDPIYQGAEGQWLGQRWSRRHLPPGAMWTMPLDYVIARPPDGRPLFVKLPDGAEWSIDGPSRDGGYWQRTGTPPRVTASPSIQTHGYHGWLRDGVLTTC